MKMCKVDFVWFGDCILEIMRDMTRRGWFRMHRSRNKGGEYSAERTFGSRELKPLPR
jgi:hypothetical protein